MGNERAEELIKKFLAGTATPEEEALLDSWYTATANSQQDLASIPDYPKLEAEILHSIEAEHKDLREPVQRKATPLIRLWPRIAAAVAVLIILSAGGFFILHKDPVKPIVQIPTVENNIILPAGTRATLTLLDGSTITLDSADSRSVARQENADLRSLKGQLVYNANGLKETATIGKIAYNTLATKLGEHYALVLSDGTKVWLNAGSSITYPVSFTSNERKVEITGEAYFEIVHNDKQTFKIAAKDQLVEDIGTHLNIKAYDDELTANTTLVEGSVKVSKGAASAILVPGKQAIWSSDADNFQIKKVNTDQAVGWKNGYFYFDGADMKTVMRELARWYNLQVIYKGELPKRTFKGKAYRNINATEALRMLSYFGAHFQIEGRTVTVTS